MKKLLIALFLFTAPAAFAAHSVSLWWTASPDSTIGNPGTTNVYRAPSACPASGTSGAAFTKVATAQQPGYTQASPWVDSAVTSGTTYCYYVTAVIGGAESAPSNTFQGTIPTGVPGGLSGLVQ